MDREIERVLDQSCTVRQLIKELKDMDQDARVLFTCTYGDYYNTQQAFPIQDITEHESDVLHESGYSQSSVAFTDPNAEPNDEPENKPDDEENETFPVVILHND